MATNFRTATIEELCLAAEALLREIETVFGDLDDEQLCWQPVPGEWSIGQCLDHLVVTNRVYFPKLRAIIQGAYHPTFWERVPLLPALFGPQLVRMMEPGQAPGMQAPAVFQPGAAETRAGNVAEFAAMQRELLALMQACTSLDAARIVVASPAAAWVTYSLLDALRIIVTHERLHLGQARQVMAQRAFPALASV